MSGGDTHMLYHKIIKYNNNLYGGVLRGDALPEPAPTKSIKVTVDDSDDDDDMEDVETVIDAMNENDDDDEYDTATEYRKELKKEADTNEDGEIEFEEGIDQDVTSLDDEDIDIEELEKIYQDTDVVADKNKAQTTTLIQQALKDDNIFKK